MSKVNTLEYKLRGIHRRLNRINSEKREIMPWFFLFLVTVLVGTLAVLPFTPWLVPFSLIYVVGVYILSYGEIIVEEKKLKEKRDKLREELGYNK